MEANGTWALLLALALLLLLTLALSGTRARGQLPPGPTPLPLLGNLLQLRPGALYSGLMRLSKKYGPVFTIYLGPWRPVVVLVGQEAVREALGGQAEEFSGRGTIVMLERTFDGHGGTKPRHRIHQQEHADDSHLFAVRWDNDGQRHGRLYPPAPDEIPSCPK
uniref:Cytochrome P450 family 2 subfamily S member 1 n=1 Tax=Colobus angolensis palliatus TaxID=336983 RepID=A0A2K5JVK6_COLAP